MQDYPSRHTALAHSQNFLKSSPLVDRLLAASTIQPGELVLDLGAGTGIMTDCLANRGCEVIAVEKDPSLASHLRPPPGACNGRAGRWNTVKFVWKSPDPKRVPMRADSGGLPCEAPRGTHKASLEEKQNTKGAETVGTFVRQAGATLAFAASP